MYGLFRMIGGNICVFHFEKETQTVLKDIFSKIAR